MSGAISENWVPFLLLLLIGVALIWWLGGRYARDAETPDSGGDNRADKKVADDRGLASTPLAPPPSVSEKPKAAPVKKTAPAKKPAAKKTEAKAAPKKAATAAKAAPKTKPAARKAPAAKAAPNKTAAPKKAKAAIPDNLELLKGVGPKLNTLLASLGITSFGQIAAWSASDIREIDAKLGTFAGRITRDNWVDQAKLLSNGDIEGFEKKYGSLGSEVKG